MTPSEIVTAANQRYNSVGDSFFPDSEAYLLIWQGCMELALAGYLIERAFTTNTVIGTQAYDFPTNVFAVNRITYNGKNLPKITMRQDDMLSLYNQDTTATGEPQDFFEFGDAFYLRPIPDAVAELKVWGYCRPQQVTSVSTLEIGEEWHMHLINLLLAEKCAKNKNYTGQASYMALWDRAVAKAEAYQRRRKRRPGFGVVTDVDMVPQTFLGVV